MGSDITGTKVSLSGVTISLQEGEGTLSGLSIANPAGFEGGDAFTLATIKLGLDLASINSNPIVIKQILVDGAAINFIKTASGSNLQTILDNVNSGGSAGDDSAAADDGGEETKLIIDDFRFTNAKMSLSVEGLGELQAVTIPDVVQKGIGRSDNGATPAEAANEMLEPILKRAVEEATRIVMKEMGGGGFLDSMKDKLKNPFGG